MSSKVLEMGKKGYAERLYIEIGKAMLERKVCKEKLEGLSRHRLEITYDDVNELVKLLKRIYELEDFLRKYKAL